MADENNQPVTVIRRGLGGFDINQAGDYTVTVEAQVLAAPMSLVLFSVPVTTLEGLRDAITSTGDGGTIVIGNDITISGSPLDIQKSLTFEAKEGSEIKLLSSGVRHMNITGGSGITVAFDGVTLNGNGGMGGINIVSGTVALDNVKVTGCNHSSNGGGVYSGGSSTLILNGGEISGNKVTGNSGGIYTPNVSQVTVTSSDVIFANNSSPNPSIIDDGNDILVHSQLIKTIYFTVPFQYAYNDYDISYLIGTTPTKYTVDYSTGLGSAVANDTIIGGGRIYPQPQSTRAGYVLVGWYKEPACVNEWKFSTDTVTANITLHAKRAMERIVQLHSDGVVKQTDIVADGSTVSVPSITKGGYKFEGWYP